jgi:type II secretory pathway pseudopilin PulG
MQRKNYILSSRYSGRGGFAMIMAVTVIVIVATIMALSLSLTTQTTKKTTDLYLYEQAVLLSKSATEYALLRIAQDGPCTHTNDLVNFSDPSGLYTIDIILKYIYTTNCAIASDNYFPAGTLMSTPEQNGSIIMDVTVSTNVGTEPIRYFRRTIQKL